MATVWIPPLLRDVTEGRETATASGATVAEVVADLERQYPGFRERLCRGEMIRPGISVIVDNRATPLGLLAALNPESEVHFLPAIGGGKS